MAEAGTSKPEAEHEMLSAEGNTSQVDTKLEKFLSEPLGSKGVSEIPGLEERHVERLRTKGIRKVSSQIFPNTIFDFILPD